jgi:hypothetical protein
MKKALVLIFIFLGSLAFANPGGEEKEENLLVESFQIMVVDAETDEPIPAAQIKIKQKDQKAYTDFDGFVEIRNMNSGIYDIEISLISYKKRLLEDFLLDNNNNQLLVKLNP